MTTTKEQQQLSYLATKNPHPRDAHIHFDEGPHTYTIEGINGVTKNTKFTSVTTWVHEHFEHFDAKKVIAAMMRNTKKWNDPVANAKYYGKTAEEIEKMWADAGREAAAKGTEMHYKIECFYNRPPPEMTDTAASTVASTDTPIQPAADTPIQPAADTPIQPATDTTTATDTATDTTTDTATDTTTVESTDTTTVASTDTPIQPATTQDTRRWGAEPPAEPPEFKYFLDFHQEFAATLKPYRTEWTVFHEEARIAGSIDMVYEEVIDDTFRETQPALLIYDWKRCREITKTNAGNKFASHEAIEHLPDTNYWHYALQLNIYKYILQNKYGKTVTDLYLVVLHPEAPSYKRIKLPDLQNEVTELFEERIRGFAAASN
jgi:hypothetical protein